VAAAADAQGGPTTSAEAAQTDAHPRRHRHPHPRRVTLPGRTQEGAGSTPGFSTPEQPKQRSQAVFTL